ncbi:MAG: hypothetical protein PVI30_24980, partial [Myxococcales bacterium]
MAHDDDGQGAGARGGWILDRREFLKLAATSAAAACAPQVLVGCDPGDKKGPGPVSRWIPIRRPDDLLVMDLGLINLVEQDGALVREDDAARSCLVLQLPA